VGRPDCFGRIYLNDSTNIIESRDPRPFVFENRFGSSALPTLDKILDKKRDKTIPEEARCANSRANNDAINADRNHERRAEIKTAGDLSLNLYRTREEERSLKRGAM